MTPFARLGAWWQHRSLGGQLVLGIALVALIAALLNGLLLGALLNRFFVMRQGEAMVQQTQALGDCCADVRALLLHLSPTARGRLIQVSLAGAPGRRALIVAPDGTLLYASPMPADVMHSLLARAQHDVALPDTATPSSWYTLGDQLVAEKRFPPDGNTGTNGAQGALLLLAEDQQVTSAQWGSALALVLFAGSMALGLVLVGGILTGRRLARPMQAMTSAAHAIAAGDFERRVRPTGPTELHALATAFNAMVDDVQRQRRAERDLVANISHELAAPLGLMQGYAEALADGVIDDREQRLAALHAISAEALRLSRLSGDLLDLALMETGQITLQIEVVPLADLLRGIAARFIPLAQQCGVTLVLDLAAPLPDVATDGLRLEQVLVNLVTNALHHTPPAGTITISGQAQTEQVTLAVADSGAGIPPEALARIWERFYRVDAGRDRRTGRAGVGLGLTISRSIVALLGGTIAVSSTVGQGTTFTLTLPVSQATGKVPDLAGFDALE
jgi:signal transduction histidine kinase